MKQDSGKSIKLSFCGFFDPDYNELTNKQSENENVALEESWNEDPEPTPKDEADHQIAG